MSFTDEEKKLIEEEEIKAEEEIRARFQSFFSKEELEDSAKEFNRAETPEDSEKETALDDKEPPLRYDVKNNDKKRPASKRPRIAGPDYSLTGHKILNDSNYREALNKLSSEKKVTAASYKVSDKLYVFGQDSIPDASNELTRSARINSTSKVRRREKQLLKAGTSGRIEQARKAQVSVFSIAERSDRYSTSYNYHSAAEVNRIIEKEKSAGTTGLSKDTVDRFLNDSKIRKEADAKKRLQRGPQRKVLTKKELLQEDIMKIPATAG